MAIKSKYIGLAGTLASGKDTIADWLEQEHGYYHVSTSDLVREIALERYGSIERPILYKTANELRNEQGHGALSHIALERYEAMEQKAAGLVVSGFRSIAEAQVIKDQGGMVLFVDAPLEVRYERMKSRARDQEAIVSLEEFKTREDRENGGVDPAFSIIAIKDIADIVITNDSDLESYMIKVRDALEV
jgi:dephospho-CoA kinase